MQNMHDIDHEAHHKHNEPTYFCLQAIKRARFVFCLVIWPESKNNGTPGPDLISVSRSYFLTQEEHTDNVSVFPLDRWRLRTGTPRYWSGASLFV